MTVSRAEWEDAVYLLLPLPAAGAVLRLARYMTWREGRGTNGRPSVDRLADECHVSERTVRRHLEAAVTAGLLVETAAHSPGRPTTYSSRLPAASTASTSTADTSDRCADQPTSVTPDTGDRCPPPQRTPVTGTPDTGDRDTGHPCPPISLTSETSCLSARKEPGTVHTTTTRETTSTEDGFGARTVAALGRSDLSATQLDQLRDRAATRLGQVLACDAAYAVAAMPGVRVPAAYMASLSTTDLRALAEQRQKERERPARRPKPAQRPPCGECSPSRRVEDPDDGRDLGPCPTCHPSAAVARAS